MTIAISTQPASQILTAANNTALLQVVLTGDETATAKFQWYLLNGESPDPTNDYIVENGTYPGGQTAFEGATTDSFIYSLLDSSSWPENTISVLDKAYCEVTYTIDGEIATLLSDVATLSLDKTGVTPTVRAYVNNFSGQLTAALSASDSAGAQVQLESSQDLIAALTDADSYCVLTLQAGDEIELISVNLENNSIVILARELENTVSRDWASGTKILCSCTATSFTQLNADISALTARISAAENEIELLKNQLNNTEIQPDLT